MWTLKIKSGSQITSYEVDTPAEIKAIFDKNKGSQYKLFQRDTQVSHSPQYVQILLKSVK